MKYRGGRLFICVAAKYSLATKQLYAFLQDFIGKVLQVIYFVTGVRSSFFNKDLRFSTALESSAYMYLKLTEPLV